MASTKDDLKANGPNRLLNLSAAETQNFLKFKETCKKEGFLDKPVNLRDPDDSIYGINDDGTLL